MDDKESTIVGLPKLITVDQLKEYMGISHVTVYQLVNQRRFPSFKVGRKWFIDTDELKKWMAREMKKGAH